MSYIGQQQTITIGGKAYTLSRLTLEIRKQFAEWVQSHIPDPLETVAKHLEKFPKDVQNLLATEAWKASQRRLDIDGPEVQAALETEEGNTKLTQLLLQKHHPEITEAEAYDLALQLRIEQFEKIKEKIKAEKLKTLKEKGVENPEITEEALTQEVLEVLQSNTFRPVS